MRRPGFGFGRGFGPPGRGFPPRGLYFHTFTYVRGKDISHILQKRTLDMLNNGSLLSTFSTAI